MLDVDRRTIGLWQVREHVRDVWLDVGKRLAVSADHLVGRLAAPAEEASIRKLQQVVGPDAVDGLAFFHAREAPVCLLARELREARTHVALVEVVEHPLELRDVHVLRFAVGEILEAVLHVRLPATLIAKHL